MLPHVISVENMRQSDAQTIANHTPSKELMRRAAQGIFDAVQFTGRIAIVCGSGNNGGDGYALACILLDHGMTPVIFRVSDKFSDDGLYYYRTARSPPAASAPRRAISSHPLPLPASISSSTACSVRAFRARRATASPTRSRRSTRAARSSSAPTSTADSTATRASLSLPCTPT